MLVVICLSFVGLLYATTDECEPCEEGDPNCGGEPGEDSVTFADRNKEEYKYSVETEKERMYLTKNNNDGETKVSTNKLTQVRSGNECGFISWDATTGIIISDSGGEYAVRNPLIDKSSPEYAAY